MAMPKIGYKKVRIIHVAKNSQYAGYRYATWNGERTLRNPRKGELYLSGANGFECAYEALADMVSPYFIAVPLTEEVPHG